MNITLIIRVASRIMKIYLPTGFSSARIRTRLKHVKHTGTATPKKREQTHQQRKPLAAGHPNTHASLLTTHTHPA